MKNLQKNFPKYFARFKNKSKHILHPAKSFENFFAFLPNYQ